MFTIRQQQIKDFDLQLQGKYLEHLKAELSEDYPDFATVDSDGSEKLLRNLIRRATGYGLSSSTSVTAFVYLALDLGPHFDTRFPAVAAILNSEGRTETEKILELDSLHETISSLLTDPQ